MTLNVHNLSKSFLHQLQFMVLQCRMMSMFQVGQKCERKKKVGGRGAMKLDALKGNVNHGYPLGI